MMTRTPRWMHALGWFGRRPVAGDGRPVRTGCAWRQVPADFPPWQTVYWHFNRWEQDKVTEQILPVVREQLRIQEGRNPQPSAGLIDSQTVKGADTVGRESRGYNAGNHAGPVVMPGSLLAMGVAAGQPG